MALGVFDSLFYRILIDLVKHDTAFIGSGSMSKQMCQVPRNSFTLTVRVGCQQYLICCSSLFLYFLDGVALASDIYVFRLEILFDITPSLLLGKSLTCPTEAITLYLLPRYLPMTFGLGRRLNYKQSLVLCAGALDVFLVVFFLVVFLVAVAIYYLFFPTYNVDIFTI